MATKKATHNQQPQKVETLPAKHGKHDLSPKGEDAVMATTKQPKYSMKGFINVKTGEPFEDIVDYIKTSTYQIWDEKGMGRIYDYYKDNAIVHTSDGETYGRDRVLTTSITKMAAFPDIRDYIDDVIWIGNDEEGFHTSMRWTFIGHYTGYGVYGPPNGRRVVCTGIANCLVKENRVVEEWVAYNEISIIKQLGLRVRDMVKKFYTDKPSVLEDETVPFGEVERLQGQNPPEVMPPKTTSGFDVDDFIRRSTHEIWNWRLFNKVDEYYVPNYLFHGASDREFYGLGDLKQYILSMISAFPDARIQIDDLYWMGDEQHGYKAAVRWILTGTHQGPGIYGPPTGKRMRVMGISNYVIKNGKFVEEWTEFGEFALLKQLYTPDGG